MSIPKTFQRQATALVAMACAASLHSASAQSAFSADSPFMTGDWGGARSSLIQNGLFLGLFYVTEFATNAKGGYNEDRVTERSDQTTALASYNLMPKFGVDGELSAVLTHRTNGNLLTLTRLNDPRSGVVTNLSQEVWGYGSVTRLTRLTYNQNFANRTLRLRVGKMTPTEEFYPTTFGCEFQSLINCGSVPGVSSIWYGWPVSTWSAMGEAKLGGDWYVRAGVYQQNPETTTNERALSLSDKGTKGQIVPVLVGWRPSYGEKKLAGNYFLAAYHSNVSSTDLLNASVTHGSKNTVWAFGEQQLTGPGGSSMQGLRVFASAVVNDPKTELLQRAYGAGFYYTGLFAGRPQDMLGFATSVVKVNDRWNTSRRAANASNGINDYNNPGYLPLADKENTTELFYRFNATKWLSVQPNLQYIKAPGGVKDVPSATVLGLRFNLSI